MTINAKKVGEIVGEIAAASSEQAQRISRMSKAIGEMDKVVQSNAANAEESASAAEELNAQAIGMRGYVDGMEILIGGEKGKTIARRGNRPEVKITGNHRLTAPRKVPALPAVSHKSQKAPPAGIKIRRPSEVIPMDDKDEFRDF